MMDEITSGIDELGVLLMGHGLTTYWTGSQLDIHEARKLVPGQNATTLQVAAAVLGGHNARRLLQAFLQEQRAGVEFMIARTVAFIALSYEV